MRLYSAPVVMAEKAKQSAAENAFCEFKDKSCRH